MAYLTTKQVLDKFLSRVRDNSAALRVKSLSWLNSLMTDVVNERTWEFLNRSVTLTITNNQITLPADFSIERSIEVGDYILTYANKLTDKEAFRSDQSQSGIVEGFTVEDGTITFHPSAEGSAILHYTAQIPSVGYADTAEATIFPLEFVTLFERALMTAFYEYDVNAELLPVGFGIDKTQMRRMKQLDNSRKAKPKVNSNGYIRER